MKKIFFIAVLAAFWGETNVWSQDLITKKTGGEDIKAKVTEVGQTEIKYRKYDNPDGPVYSIPVSEVLIIRYENGTNDVFNTVNAPVPMDGGKAAVSEGIVPGMRYKDYKKLYKARDYVHEAGDRYSPALGGVLSWIIPGLGQMVNGEIGRGFGYLGGTLACGVVMGAGAGLAYDYPGVAMVMMLAGSAALLSVDIAAIVDGVKMAKIKNMYDRDIRGMAAVDMKLSPYFAAINTGMSACRPVAGVSLRVSF